MRKWRWIALVAVVTIPAAVPAALNASADSASATTRTLTATLTNRDVVRRPVVKRATTGRFTATLVNPTARRPTLRWRLTYTKLRSMAFAAHIHRGKARRNGPIATNLCGPCRSGQRGSTRITRYAARAILSRTAYVEVHTKTNLLGELRGQISLR